MDEEYVDGYDIRVSDDLREVLTNQNGSLSNDEGWVGKTFTHPYFNTEHQIVAVHIVDGQYKPFYRDEQGHVVPVPGW